MLIRLFQLGAVSAFRIIDHTVRWRSTGVVCRTAVPVTTPDGVRCRTAPAVSLTYRVGRRAANSVEAIDGVALRAAAAGRRGGKRRGGGGRTCGVRHTLTQSRQPTGTDFHARLLALFDHHAPAAARVLGQPCAERCQALTRHVRPTDPTSVPARA